jgi:peroxiredoxin
MNTHKQCNYSHISTKKYLTKRGGGQAQTPVKDLPCRVLKGVFLRSPRSNGIWFITILLGVMMAGIMGSWLGSAYGERRHASKRVHEERESLQAMAARPGGIAVGRRFPEFPLWSVRESITVSHATELLPQGGLLVSILPTCQTCLDVAISLNQARHELEAATCSVVLVLNGHADEALLDSLREHKIDFPLYFDPAQSLFREYGVEHNPAYFLLDSAGVVRFVGFGPKTASEITQVISAYSPGRSGFMQKGGEKG